MQEISKDTPIHELIVSHRIHRADDHRPVKGYIHLLFINAEEEIHDRASENAPHWPVVQSLAS